MKGMKFFCGVEGARAHKFSRIGDQWILNTNSTIEHECVLGHEVHNMPGALLAGDIKFGDLKQDGTDQMILPSLKIGN